MRFFIILTVLNTFIDYQSQKCIEKAWEITDNEKLPLLQAMYLQCAPQDLIRRTLFSVLIENDSNTYDTVHSG